MAKQESGDFNRFFRGEDIHGNVVFNMNDLPIDQISVCAKSYHDAGKLLVGRLSSSRVYSDYDGYPILFLYRHALELYLKAIVYRLLSLCRLLSNDEADSSTLTEKKFLARHELLPMLPSIEAGFHAMGWVWELDDCPIRSWEDFRALVTEIEKLDPRSYSFRYPMQKDGSAALPQHLIINVITFASNMDPLLELLDGALTGIEERLDARGEVEGFLRDLVAEWNKEI